MKITNTQGLPRPLVEAVNSRAPYEGEREISVSEIINPPLIRSLTRKYWDSIEEDVTERLWALFGTAVHAILQENSLASTEEEVRTEFEGWQIIGHIDHLAIYTDLVLERLVSMLTDWKVTSVWSLIFSPGGKEGRPTGRVEWHHQLRLYHWLLGRSGKPVPQTLADVVILRDWAPSQLKKARSSGRYYPERPVVTIPVDVWPKEKFEGWLQERLSAFEGTPALCTEEERWERKPGEPTRCKSHCSVARWCEYGKAFS